jgi:excisionase family DNA binding protein
MPSKSSSGTDVPTLLHHLILPDQVLAELLGRHEEVLNLGEAAAFLRVSEQDVLRMVREQGLPARQVGEEWRFLKAAVRDWLRAGTPRPSRKEAQLALAGKYRDDPDLMRICKEAYQQRGRPMTEED